MSAVETRGAPGWWRPVLVLEVLVGAALRLAVFLRPLPVLDRLFVPDDTYYTLTIARSLAHGHGPTTDGHVLTSGFQPLLAFLMVPVYWLTGNPDTALRADIALLLACDVAVVVLLALLARRMAGPVAGCVAAGVWALSANAVRLAAGGLETTLALAAALLLTLLWLRAQDDASTARSVLAGVAAGLAVLARIDVLALVALLAAVQLLRGPRRALLPFGAAAVLTLAPWWGYCIAHFGTPVPTSGPAAHSLQSGGAFNRFVVSISGANAATGPFSAWPNLQVRLVGERATWPFWLALGGFVLVGTVLLVAGAVRVRRRGRTAPAAMAALGAWAAFAAALLVFYAWLDIPYYTHRYLGPVSAAETLLLAALVGLVWQRAATRPGVPAAVRGAVLALVLFALAVPAPPAVHRLLTWTARPQRLDTSFDANTGYRQQARWLNSIVPRGAVVGGAQTGALSYFAGAGRTVVNLDGVVNPDAYRARRHGRLAQYARDRGVRWIADWPFTVELYRQELARLDPPVRLRRVAVLQPVGITVFWVAEVTP